MKNSLAVRNRIKNVWVGLPESWRTQLASAWHTFLPAFGTSLFLSLEALKGQPIGSDVILATASAILLSALRSGFKAVSVWFFSRVLRDPKESK